MRDYIKNDAWNIIEEGFDPELNRISESIFSIGNGKIGQHLRTPLSQVLLNAVR